MLSVLGKGLDQLGLSGAGYILRGSWQVVGQAWDWTVQALVSALLVVVRQMRRWEDQDGTARHQLPETSASSRRKTGLQGCW